MNNDEWETIAVGPELGSSSGYDDDWETIGEGPDLPSGKKAEKPVSAYDLAGSALQGLTFGFGDELMAGVNSLAGRGSYDDELARERYEMESFEGEHPYAAGAAELAGAVPTALAFPAGAGARTIGQAAVRGAASGAVYGGVTGYGKGEGIENRLENAATGAEVGAGLGAVGGFVGQAAAKKTAQRADDLRMSGMGVTKGDLVKGSRKGRYYVDAAGNRVGIDDATDAVTRLEQDFDLIKADKFFNEKGVSSNARKTGLALDRRVSELSDDVDALMTTARSAVNDFTKQTGIVPRFKVDFSDADAYVAKVAKANPARGRALNKELEGVKANWESSNRSFDDIVEFRRSAGEQPRIFEGTNSAVEQDLAKLKRTIYSSFQRSAEDNFNGIAKAIGKPELAGALKETNRLTSAYKSFEKPLQKRAAESGVLKSLPSFKNAVAAGSAWNAAQKAAPMAAAKALERAGGFADMAGRGLPAATHGLPGANAPNPPEDEIVSAFMTDIPKDDDELNKLVEAIIHVESRGNPKAVSPAGAKGIMQLMPANIKHFGVKDPFNPDENRAAGTKLFQEELERFGDVALALAAYNAGSPKVMQAIKKAKSTDFESIKKYLPRETQDYVVKVLARV